MNRPRIKHRKHLAETRRVCQTFLIVSRRQGRQLFFFYLPFIFRFSRTEFNGRLWLYIYYVFSPSACDVCVFV